MISPFRACFKASQFWNASRVHSSWRQLRGLLTLAIESSCDDTSVALLETDPVPNHAGQAAAPLAVLHFHRTITSNSTGCGGIHPLIALQSHQQNLATLVKEALRSVPERGHNDGRPDLIAVTRGPGMRSNLNTGLDTAKGLAVAWDVPLVACHHMQAHALTARLMSALETRLPDERPQHGDIEPTFPFLSLLVSGGHTLLVHSSHLTEHKILASTTDLAVGDAIDKAARMILHPSILEQAQTSMYGRLLEEFVRNGPQNSSGYRPPHTRGEEIARVENSAGWSLRPPLADTSRTKRSEFSFSGLLSEVAKFFDQPSSAQLTDDQRRELGSAFMRLSFEHLASRVILALEDLSLGSDQGAVSAKALPTTLVVSGGVAANHYLRTILRAVMDIRGYSSVRLIFPPPSLCTDNAAMIAWTGTEMYEAGWTSQLSCQSLRKWSLDSGAADGGIIGVGGWTRR